MPKLKIISAFILSAFIIFAFSSAAFAQGSGQNPGDGSGSNPNNPPGVIDFPNPFKGGNSLFALLKTVINSIVLPIGGVVAVLAFIYSGFLYVMAQGNESKLATAHKSLLFTSIGTAVLLGSWVLANVICRTIGELGGPICPV